MPELSEAPHRRAGMVWGGGPRPRGCAAGVSNVEVDREGEPTGRYIMLFEFHTREGHHAYKERRKDWSGPYAEYKTVDPYQFFDLDSVTTDYWEPQEEDLWFEFD